MSFEIDTGKWSDQAKRLIRATGRDAGDVLKQEGRLFLQDCVRLTPPTSKRPFAESYNVQRRAGEKAVENDIRKVFKDPLQLDMVKGHPQIHDALQKYAAGIKPSGRNISNAKIKKLLSGGKTKSMGAFEAAITLLRRIGVKAPIILEATKEIHAASRGAGGRTLRRAHIVLRSKSIDRLIKGKQKLVGKEKGGWVTAATGLGIKLPAWITRHGGSPGIWKDDSAQENPSITIGNLVSYAQAHGPRLQIIKRAFDRRVESMKTRLEHIVSKNFREH